jgi:hypothetical protein
MSWSALLIGPVLVALLFVSWLGVQRLWRRAFKLPEQADALQGRESCLSCACSTTCHSPDRQRLATEATHDH